MAIDIQKAAQDYFKNHPGCQKKDCYIPGVESCDSIRIEVEILGSKGCDSESMESFDVSTWTPEQFEALRRFLISSGARTQ